MNDISLSVTETEFEFMNERKCGQNLWSGGGLFWTPQELHSQFTIRYLLEILYPGQDCWHSKMGPKRLFRNVGKELQLLAS